MMESIKTVRFIILVFIAGFGGAVVQTVLLRELLVMFSGNEFSIGIIISAWVVCEAIGAYTGGKLNNRYNVQILTFSIILFSLFFPACIYMARIFKALLDIPTGVGAGFIFILCSSFIIILPVGILHGFFFTLACSVYNQISTTGATTSGKVYFYEMLGTIAGGITVSIIFIPYLNAFFIALSIIIISAFFSMVFLGRFNALQQNAKKSSLFLFSAVLIVSAFIIILFNIDSKLHAYSIKMQWQKQDVVSYQNSVYQNIVVIKNEDQYTFFTDGIPFITTPVPDISFVEEFAHFPLLAHSHPKTVLILGGGTGGVINEVIKHPDVKRIDYVETDPELLKAIKRFSTPLTQTELNNPIVRLIYVDGRIFFRKMSHTYDVVLIGLPPPATLQMNRFYTEEFFTAIKASLNADGILALTMPGSYAYYSSTLKELNKSIISTIGSVFPHVFVLPGEYNIIFASKSHHITAMSFSVLFKALKERCIETKLLTLPHLNDRFEKKRQDWFASSIKDTTASINRDFSPRGLYYSIAYQNLLFSPYLKPLFESAKHVSISHALGIIACIFVLFLFISRKQRRIGIPYAITTTGFAAMVSELVLIFSFQIFYGYVFYEIGILITVFMAGMAAGSLIATCRCHRTLYRSLSLMKTVDAAMAIFPLMLILICLFPQSLYSMQVSSIRFIFYILLIISGFFAGMQFPLANVIYLGITEHDGARKNHVIGNTAGILYGLDLIGGCFGGIIGGLILLPVLGFLNTCLIIAVLKTTSLVLLYTLHSDF